jgi:manganese/iron transport system ATP-binding protein
LRGIVGLIPVATGSLEFGFDRTKSPLGYVPQRESLDPTFPLTVLEVVIMGTYARLSPWRRVGRAERRLAREALAMVGLEPLADQRFAALSGGQRQRALIARALAAEPSFLLLDEPTAGVDAEATAAIMAVLGRLNRDEGLTVLLVTHQLRVLQGLATSAFWVQSGRVTRRGVEDMMKGPAFLDVPGS